MDKEDNTGKEDLNPEKKVRQGWDEQFKKIAAQCDDKLLDADIISSEWDDKEWEWR